MLGVPEPNRDNGRVLGFHSPVISLEICREGSCVLVLYLRLTWINWNRNISFLWSLALLNTNELERSKQIISTHSWHNSAVDKEQIAMRAGTDQTTESLPSVFPFHQHKGKIKVVLTPSFPYCLRCNSCLFKMSIIERTVIKLQSSERGMAFKSTMVVGGDVWQCRLPEVGTNNSEAKFQGYKTLLQGLSTDLVMPVEKSVAFSLRKAQAASRQAGCWHGPGCL